MSLTSDRIPNDVARPTATADAFAKLAADGWAIFASADSAMLSELRSIAHEVREHLRSHPADGHDGRDVERGLRAVWRFEDADVRRSIQTRVGDLFRPWCFANLPGYRLVSFGLTFKLAGVPQEPLPFHRDFTLVDERSGVAALSVWMPLVDVSRENGALVVVSGTHRTSDPIRPLGSVYKDPLVGHSLDDLPPNAHQPQLAAGSALVFDSRTTHASTRNDSPDDRPVVIGLLVPEGVPTIEWIQRGPVVELWELEEDGLSFVERTRKRRRLLETIPSTLATPAGDLLPSEVDAFEPRAEPMERAGCVLPGEPSQQGADARDAIARLFGGSASRAGWSLRAARVDGHRLECVWQSANGVALPVTIERAVPDRRYFRRIRELGLFYAPPRNGTSRLDTRATALLEQITRQTDRAIDSVRAILDATGG